MDATSHLADARTQVRLRRGLVGEHTGWYQRIHASLFHHGLPERSQLLTADGGAWLGRVELPAVARQAVEVALRMIDHLESNSTPSTPSWLASPGPSQAARRSSGAMDRVADRGGDLGRVRRRAPLRRQPPSSPLLCLDITITESDGKRARGHLARQGAPVLRWALHQAAMCAARPSAPDHAAYLQVRQRLGGKRAALSVAPKLAREASHTLRELGDQALVPPSSQPPPEQDRPSCALGAWIVAVVRLAPCCSCRHTPVVDGLHTTSGHTRHLREPDHHQVAGPSPSTETRLDTRARHAPCPPFQATPDEVMPRR